MSEEAEESVVYDSDEAVDDQALETAEEVEAKSGETEEVEIVIDGEEEPTSETPRRSTGFERRLKRLAGQRDDAQTEAEGERVRREAAEEEAKLLRMKLQQRDESKPPAPEDFDTDAEYDAAKSKYDDNRIAVIAEQKARDLLAANQSKTTQAQQGLAMEESIREHYNRVEKLKLPDFDETEDAAIDVLGNDLYKTIVANTGKSEVLLYHLGKNPGKAQALADMAKSNPVGCVMEIGRLESALRVRPKHDPAPDPEAVISGGSATLSKRGPPGVVYE